jgi:cytoskeletal protein CcmA (bactofilin family)
VNGFFINGRQKKRGDVREVILKEFTLQFPPNEFLRGSSSMFGKSAAHQEPQSESVESTTAADRFADVKRRATKVQHSIISADTTLTGDLKSEGDITVEGTIDGNIQCRSLTLSGEPVIKGSANAESAFVSGTFKGDIRAKKVVLTKTAKMRGDIYNETLEIQPGADFQGEVGRLDPEKPAVVDSVFPAKANGAEPQSGASQPAA